MLVALTERRERTERERRGEEGYGGRGGWMQVAEAVSPTVSITTQVPYRKKVADPLFTRIGAAEK